jgi:hypothetical protein
MLSRQQHAVDAEARGLGLGDALRWRWWSCLWALVDGALVLLAQGAFALLLALLFDEGLRCTWNLGLSPQGASQQHAGQHGTRVCFQFLSLNIFLIGFATR